ncbi:hypothetical protein K9N50_07190 [bacterium]|nr:hypothetical protein [bacterium]
MNKSSLKRKLIWLTIFAITMGYFEAALVEYLRELYYPEGFAFPMREIPLPFLLIEIGREIASIFMLVSVGALAGCCFIDRFAAFMFIFGVWDIVFYAFLRLFENWPPSVFTWDLLFLLPLPWIGPVWAPVLVSIALIWAAVSIWLRLEKGIIVKPTRAEWIGEILAGSIIIASFISGFQVVLKKEIPQTFPWYVWLIGMSLGILIFIAVLRRTDRIES